MKIKNEKLFNNEDDRFLLLSWRNLCTCIKETRSMLSHRLSHFLGLKLTSLLAQVSSDSGQAISWRWMKNCTI